MPMALSWFRLACSVAACGLLLGLSSVAGAADDAAPPRLSLPRVDLTIDAEGASGPWTMTVTNHGPMPVRVLADARKLSLLVRAPHDRNYSVCELPSDMRGPDDQRRLVLRPGQSYQEELDPRLFCWGKLDKLKQGSSVTGFLGWAPDARRSRLGKPQVAPFAVSAVTAPPEVASVKRLSSQTVWLTKADEPAAATKPAAKHVGEPRLELQTPRYVSASSPRSALLDVEVKNTGDAAALVHIRPDNLVLQVARPDGTSMVCEWGTKYRASARDLFRTIRPGRSHAMSVLVAEACPKQTFDRPGVYEIRPVLRVQENGAQFGLEALTGEFAAERRTLLRLLDAPLPYHDSPPRARPAAR